MILEPDDLYSDEYLEHIGTPRHSGRYPWGSGDAPFQRNKDFAAHVKEMRDKGLTDAQIAQGLGLKSTGFRAAIAASTEQIRAENVARAMHLRLDRQMSNVAIAEAMGTRESTVRGWLKPAEDSEKQTYRSVGDHLLRELEAKPYLDVGAGNHLWLGITDQRLKTSVEMLKAEGYNVHSVKLPQLGTDKMTEYKILTKGDVTWAQAREAAVAGNVQTIFEPANSSAMTYKSPAQNPTSLSSKRVDVRYANDGGTKMDGVIEIRRGVEDLNLGVSRYAQVRVAVDGTHYLKGMAMYADDLPAGVDVRFNTNKQPTGNKLDAMKKMESDPANRFGAITKPTMYTDKSGKEKKSALNIVNEEGRWDEWSKSLSSQMLSKQSITLAAQQLGITQTKKKKDLDEIMGLTNPVVKEKLLKEFADSADSAAVHLKAAALKGQASRVILPINKMRPNEIYAPGLDNGTRVSLVRYPHGGPFEIPELTVNNKNLTAKRILENARDAVGIHHSVAERLSGADFDGDTVLVIPNDSKKVKSRPPLAGLVGFEPKERYPEYEGMVRMTKKQTQQEMGKISNLITDMTIKGASELELARAVRHSMVVIDAEKHKLNFRQSAKDNNIAELKTRYQGGPTKGASTIISRASKTQRIDQQTLRKAKDGGPIDPKTGALVWEKTGKGYDKEIINPRTGEVLGTKWTPNTTKGTEMEFVKDARKLSSGEPMEELYASHANTMKALANQARKEMVAVKYPPRSPAAAAVYRKEVQSLDAKLQKAERNAPLERRAQVIGNARAKARIDANPQLTEKSDHKKIKYQSLEEARLLTGAGKDKIVINDREWQAIQASAIGPTKLRKILQNADIDVVKELATPRSRTSLTPGQMARIKQMEASGRTPSEMAEALGIPRSTISDNLSRE